MAMLVSSTSRFLHQKSPTENSSLFIKFLKKAIKSTFTFLIIALVLVEVGLRLMATRDEKMSDHQLRNSTLLRGWPEYTSRSNSDNGVILIGNSQAIGQEFHDTDKIYASAINTRLNDLGFTFQNWSISGLRIDQMEMLILKAIQQKPRLIVFSLAASNINNHKLYEYTRDITDLHLTLSEPSNLSELPNNFFFDTFHIKDWLIGFFQRYSAIGRSRIDLFDSVAEGSHSKKHKFLFGHKRSQRALINVDRIEISARKRNIRPLQAPMTADIWERQFESQRLPTFEAFYKHLEKRLEKHDIKLLWVWMPFAEREDTKPLLAGMQRFYKRVCNTIQLSQHDCYDLSGSVNNDYFLSADVSSHLTEQGHKEYAAKLMPIIENAVH